MIRNIFILVMNDLAISFNSKSFFLVIFVPLFIIASVKLTDHPQITAKNINLGLLQNTAYPPAMLKNIADADRAFTVYRVSLEEGRQKLRDGKLDGVLINNTSSPEGLTLLVLKKESFRTAALMEGFSVLQKTAPGRVSSWFSDIEQLQKGGPQAQMLPAWILMVVLLVSLIIIPSQVAEEKEKNLLAGLLQTPMLETEWLLARLFSGLILINFAVIILHLPEGFSTLKNPGYVLFLEMGSFCFLSFGVLLGFLCRTQASARTIGILFYIPLLVPPALSDFSQKLNKIAAFVPSYQLYNPIKSILLENASLLNFSPEWIFLFLFGTAAFLLSRGLMKRRWLM